MSKYNSFLYGNGLTIAVLSKIKDKSAIKINRYLDCNEFIFDFVNAKNIREYCLIILSTSI